MYPQSLTSNTFVSISLSFLIIPRASNGRFHLLICKSIHQFQKELTVASDQWAHLNSVTINTFLGSYMYAKSLIVNSTYCEFGSYHVLRISKKRGGIHRGSPRLFHRYCGCKRFVSQHLCKIVLMVVNLSRPTRLASFSYALDIHI